MTSVHAQIRAAYEASGLTQEEIAWRAGVSRRTLWKAMCGRNVETDSLFAILMVLGVSSLTVPPDTRTCER